MNKKSIEKTIIIILAVLLTISIAFLAVFIIKSKRKTVHTEIPDNKINEQNIYLNRYSGTISSQLMNEVLLNVTKTKDYDGVLEIYFNHASDSSPFHVDNMFPGDSIKKTYKVDIYHDGEVTVDFTATIKPGYEKLAEVLMCKVTLKNSETVLYDGLMSGLSEKVQTVVDSVKAQEDELLYEIEVYLDTSVGNEYQNKSLYADFEWKVTDEGHLIPPTGDSSKIIVISAVVLVLGIAIIILVKRRRKNEKA